MKPSGVVLDHYTHPRNRGILEDADADAAVVNPQCGDVLRLHLKIENGVVTKVRWQAEGCGTSIAASSLASELLKGQTVERAAALTRKAIEGAMGGLPPAKAHCAVLAADAIREALKDYQRRRARTTGRSARALD